MYVLCGISKQTDLTRNSRFLALKKGLKGQTMSEIRSSSGVKKLKVMNDDLLS
jgi:hypothetical protein